MEKEQISSDETKEKKLSIKEKFIKIIEDKGYLWTFLKQFSIIVIVYGLLFNFAFYHLFDVAFNILNLLSLGFLSYFIKEEIPDIVKACKN